MRKTFNVAADCKQNLHYMVNLDTRLAEIRKYVERGEYFVINRARQYGKTTTLRALKEYLQDEYYVISMDFQVQMSGAKFRNENTFSVAFANAFVRMAQKQDAVGGIGLEQAAANLKAAVEEDKEGLELVELFQHLSEVCSMADRPLVLMIDEIDSAANNQVFLDFLAQLRGAYIDRDKTPTFRSVILAGVYDIKNLKRKFRSEESHKMNSPWNIAADFKVDMSFSADDIAGMLEEYEGEQAVGMDIAGMSELIFDYTAGYPFLVSKLCKLMDEEVPGLEHFPDRKAAWTFAGFLEAERMLLADKNTLFESMVNKLYEYPELKEIISTVLFMGKEIPYNALEPGIGIAEMFGFIKNKKGTVAIANRIFETVFYDFFLSSAESRDTEIYKAAVQDKNRFVCEGHLNMELVLERFVVHFGELYGDCTDKFKEEDGRRYFLL